MFTYGDRLVSRKPKSKGGVLKYTGTGEYDDYLDRVQIIKLGVNFPENIPLNTDLTMEEFESYFERKPGSKARHVTLLLLECFWKVENITLGKTFTYNNITVNVPETGESEKVYIKRPAEYKSLIQKIIRSRPEDAEPILRKAIWDLCMCQGAFVPDLQKFVGGAESAFKRVGISILEDSYIDLKDIDWIFERAFLAAFTEYFPCASDIEKLVELGVKAYYETRWWDYDTQHHPKSNEKTPRILDTIGSFKTDQNMTHHIYLGAPVKDSKLGWSLYFPYHHYDHHWIPEMVYLYPKAQEFSKIIHTIWTKNTGLNIRKKPVIRSQKILELQKRAYEYPPTYEYDTTVKVLYVPCQDEIDAASGIITKGSYIGFRSNGEVTILPKPTRNAKKLEVPDNVHIDFRKVYEMCAKVVSDYLASITEPAMIIADSISDRLKIASKTGFIEYENHIPKSGGVVVHKRQSAGYRLIHLDKQYTGVYFSNQADREQLQGRIVVYGMQKKVTYYTVVCGITVWMHANHLHANSISQILKMIN